MQTQKTVSTVSVNIMKENRENLNNNNNNNNTCNNNNNSDDDNTDNENAYSINDQLLLDMILLGIRGETIKYSSRKKKLKQKRKKS